MRTIAIVWCAGGALGLLGLRLLPAAAQLPRPTQLLIPANLFTGILCCGLICLLNPWMDRRFCRARWACPSCCGC